MTQVGHSLRLNDGNDTDQVQCIQGLEFGVCTDEDNRRFSVCCVDNQQLGTPGGPDDGRMGTSDPSVCCQTCSLPFPRCKGHFGHVELHCRIPLPYTLRMLEKLLRNICFLCAEPKHGKMCARCECPFPSTVVLDPNSVRVEWASNTEWPQEMPENTISEILNQGYDFDMVYDLVSCVSDETVANMGLTTHPRDMLPCTLAVPPHNLRPTVQCKGKACHNDQTLLIQDIVKASQLVAEAQSDAAAKRNLLNHISRYLTADPKSSTAVQKRDPIHTQAQMNSRARTRVMGILTKMDGKSGDVRKHFMGKRCNHTARSVVTGRPDFRMDEVGIPRHIAETLTVPERVTRLNISTLQACVDAGPNRVGGAKSVVFDGGIETISEDPEHTRPRLRIGCIVNRYLKERDIVLLNRAPTLHKASMMQFYVRFTDQKTFSFHPSVTTPFNADFDGDEMNIHILQSEAARAEAITLHSVASNLLGGARSHPLCGCIQDAVLGLSLLSKSECVLSPDQLQYLGLPSTHAIAGVEAISTRLPRGLYYDNKGVLIEDGVLKRGFLSKSTLGPTEKGIVHIIALDFGPDTAMRTIEKLTTLGCSYADLHGCSTSPDDCTLTEHERDIVARITAVCEQSTNPDTLDYANRVLESISPEHTSTKETGLANMIQSGSKGNSVNMLQMRICLGQQYVRGQVLQPDLDGRVLPLFKPGDDKMAARGYISNSFLKGLTPGQMFYHGCGGREGIVDTAVKTADCGYASRKLIKALEDIFARHDGMAVLSSGVEVCPLGGGHMCGPERMVAVTMDSLSLTSPEQHTILCPSLASKYRKELQRIMFRPWRHSKNLSYRCVVPVDVHRLFQKHLKMDAGRGECQLPCEADVVGLASISPSPFHRYMVATLPATPISQTGWKKFMAEVRKHLNLVRVEAGAPIGACTAPYIGEPLTQMTLNTFHYAGCRSECGGARPSQRVAQRLTSGGAHHYPAPAVPRTSRNGRQCARGRAPAGCGHRVE